MIRRPERHPEISVVVTVVAHNDIRGRPSRPRIPREEVPRRDPHVVAHRRAGARKTGLGHLDPLPSDGPGVAGSRCLSWSPAKGVSGGSEAVSGVAVQTVPKVLGSRSTP